jgi:hypothetical protein
VRHLEVPRRYVRKQARPSRLHSLQALTFASSSRRVFEGCLSCPLSLMSRHIAKVLHTVCVHNSTVASIGNL